MNFLSKTMLLGIALSLLPYYQVKADSYPLSPESKTKIALVAALGGMIAGGLGYMAYLGKPTQNQNQSQKDEGFWKKVTKFPWHYVMIPAALGAAVSGLITYYFFTPEKMQEWIDNNLMKYEFELKDIENCTDINQLKISHYNASFPTVAAFDRLDYLNYCLNTIKKDVSRLMQCGIKPVVTVAQACLKKINHYQKVLADRLINLKNDPSYFKEVLIKTEIRAKDEIAYAQRQMADAHSRMAAAAMTQANAAMVQALNQKPTVVVNHYPK